VSELKVDRPWYESVNVKALSNDVRRKILKKVKEKLGYNKTVEVLGISRVLYTTIRTALEYYIETGDFRTVAKIAGMAVDEFLYLTKYEANIPTTD
jgi:hypothetical protein